MKRHVPSGVCEAHGVVKKRLKQWIHTKASFESTPTKEREMLAETIIDTCKHIKARATYLGGGAWGSVFVELGLACKFAPIRSTLDAQEFREEVRYTSKMANANVAPELFDHFVMELDDRSSIGVMVMALGKDTRQYLRENPKSFARVERSAKCLVERMLRFGVYCSDFKPGNTVVIGTKLRMIDWGPQYCTQGLHVPKPVQAQLATALNALMSMTFALHAQVPFFRAFQKKAMRSNIVACILIKGTYPGVTKLKGIAKKQKKLLQNFAMRIHRQVVHYVRVGKIGNKSPREELENMIARVNKTIPHLYK